MSAPRHLDHDWWPAPLPDNVELGRDAYLYSTYAFLHYRSRRPAGVAIGDHSSVYSGTTFDLGPEGQVHIGRYCMLAAVFFATDARVTIGDYAMVGHTACIADGPVALPPPSRPHPCLPGPEPRVGASGPAGAPGGPGGGTSGGAVPGGVVVGGDRPGEQPLGGAGAGAPRQGGRGGTREIRIGDLTWIGMKAVLLPGAELGEGVIVGAGTVLDFAVPPYAVVAGNPARIVGRAPPGGGR